MRKPFRLVLLAGCPLSVFGLWPAPQELNTGNGLLRLSADFKYSLNENLKSLKDLTLSVEESQDRVRALYSSGIWS